MAVPHVNLRALVESNRLARSLGFPDARSVFDPDTDGLTESDRDAIRDAHTLRDAVADEFAERNAVAYHPAVIDARAIRVPVPGDDTDAYTLRYVLAEPDEFTGAECDVDAIARAARPAAVADVQRPVHPADRARGDGDE